jgi:hypothetical protein
MINEEFFFPTLFLKFNFRSAPMLRRVDKIAAFLSQAKWRGEFPSYQVVNFVDRKGDLVCQID